MSQSAVTLFVGIVLYVVTDGPIGLVSINKLYIHVSCKVYTAGRWRYDVEDFVRVVYLDKSITV